MAVKNETELYLPIKDFFARQGYDIKSEVRHCDLVGLREGDTEPLIIEIKKTFNLPLLLQGVERLKLSSNVYVAVERNRAKKGAHNQRWGDLTDLCRRLGLGLLTVTLYKTKAPFIEILCEPAHSATPARTPRKNSRKKERLLKELAGRSGDYNLGGSTGVPLITAYREKALRIANAFGDEETLSPRQLRDATGIGTAAAILQDNHYRWFERVSRGRYHLTAAGRQALHDYAHVLQPPNLASLADLPEYTEE
ncbi:DUF2161 family putative PD-(D/E)XK-type phosphodiesterase [Paenibacillus bovis]|uniref:Uncharacterized protein n=1 Tax=Paenibacillus bovis TaxID=1616788 RepID=A0A172ZEX8_9BACL|nr:DUF2161 family putative PD-(D/E)XK-type phosphodiesterase [Paenibacillus bovis]ANF96204.1 hypothetical protein AR543_09465 [Paenibacillus bovis]